MISKVKVLTKEDIKVQDNTSHQETITHPLTNHTLIEIRKVVIKDTKEMMTEIPEDMILL